MEKIAILYYLWLVGKTIKIANLAGPGNYKVDSVTTSKSMEEETLLIVLKRTAK